MFSCLDPEVSLKLFLFHFFQGWGTEKEKGQGVFQGRATEKILSDSNRKGIREKQKCLLNTIYFISFFHDLSLPENRLVLY